MSVREEIVGVARWGVRNEARIHYATVRPMPLRRVLPLTTDCSGFATLCYFLAGAEDPNGLNYIGQGYTGTLLRHMRHVGRAAAQRGDLVVWGRYPGRHVAVVLEAGEDPLLCSHGQEKGPLEIRFSEEGSAQPPPATWLSCLP
jgi:cell wall-associated NlpC family hydrolase